jgi:hypothetical protein
MLADRGMVLRIAIHHRLLGAAERFAAQLSQLLDGGTPPAGD